MNKDDTALLEALCARRAVAVLRAPSAAGAVEACRAMLRGGMTVMEITTTTVDWPDALAGAADLDGVIAGIGTLVEPRQAVMAKESGAGFAVSPGYLPSLADACAEAQLPYMPGIATPSELMAARAHPGVTALKLFPAKALGGVGYLKALRGPFPDADLLPTGGINADNAREYIDAGAFAVGMSSPCKGDLIEREAWDRIEAIAREIMAALA